jgi:hypothetical protein
MSFFETSGVIFSQSKYVDPHEDLQAGLYSIIINVTPEVSNNDKEAAQHHYTCSLTVTIT